MYSVALEKFRPDGGMLYFAETIQVFFQSELYCNQCITNDGIQHFFARDSKGNHNGQAYRYWMSNIHAIKHPVFRNEEFTKNASTVAEDDDELAEEDTELKDKLNAILTILIRAMKKEKKDCGKLIALAKGKSVDWETYNISLLTSNYYSSDEYVRSFKNILTFLSDGEENAEMNTSFRRKLEATVE